MIIVAGSLQVSALHSVESVSIPKVCNYTRARQYISNITTKTEYLKGRERERESPSFSRHITLFFC
jgi:hypothetical protein